MFRLSAVRASHFLPSILLLVSGLAAAYVRDLSVFFTSLFNVLPTLVLLLGGAYCAVYRRQRELFLMVTVYIAYFLLDTQTDYYRDHGKVREDAAVVFHLVCLLLPALFGLFGAWQERTHLAQDMLARFAVLFAVGSVTLALEQSYPQTLLTWLAEIRWPSLHGQWMSLIQLAYPLFLGVFILLVVQYLREPRPLHAAQITGLVGIFWMLPQTFILPFTPEHHVQPGDADDRRSGLPRGLPDGVSRRTDRPSWPPRTERTHAAPGPQLCNRHDRRGSLQEIQ